MVIPKLDIDIRNWSQDMWVLKGGNLEKVRASFNYRIEINEGPPILIHVFTLYALLSCSRLRWLDIGRFFPFFFVRFMNRSQFEFLKNKANMYLLTLSLTF